MNEGQHLAQAQQLIILKPPSHGNGAAPSFADTGGSGWVFTTGLLQLAPSPLTALNRTVAILQLYGPDSAIEALQSIRDKKKLESFILYHSLLGEILHVKQERKCISRISIGGRINAFGGGKRM